MANVSALSGAAAVHAASSTTNIASGLQDFVSGRASEYVGQKKLTTAQEQQGLCLNTQSVHLTGNSHFPNWWDVVPKDTEIVVAQGSAFRGQNLKIGYSVLQDAGIIYAKRNAGVEHHVDLNIPGKPGEQVTVQYYRLNQASNFAQQGTTLVVSNSGQAAMIGGDAANRDFFFKVQKSSGAAAQRVSSGFVRKHDGAFGWGEKRGQVTTTFGGEANMADAQRKHVTPMISPNR